MSYSTAQSIELVRRAIFETPAIQDLIEERVYTRHLRDEEVTTIRMPLVVVAVRKSPMAYSSKWRKREFHIYAYSNNSQDEARQLYALVRNRLHFQCLKEPEPSKFRAIPTEIDDGMQDWNPQVRAWFVRGVWRVQGGD